MKPVSELAYDSIRAGAPGLSDATCKVIAASIARKFVNAAPIETDGLAHDLARDRAYRDGLRAGFQMGEHGEVERYESIRTNLDAEITSATKELAANLADTQVGTSKASEPKDSAPQAGVGERDLLREVLGHPYGALCQECAVVEDGSDLRSRIIAALAAAPPAASRGWRPERDAIIDAIWSNINILPSGMLTDIEDAADAILALPVAPGGSGDE